MVHLFAGSIADMGFEAELIRWELVKRGFGNEDGFTDNEIRSGGFTISWHLCYFVYDTS